MQFQIAAFCIKYNKLCRKYEGFTLIELLVVVIIIGIMSAVALPTFLGQTGKAKETEAKKNLSSIGLAQQTYFFERGTFADNLTKLNVSFQRNYYNFPEPTLVNANVVKHQADAENPVATNTRNYGDRRLACRMFSGTRHLRTLMLVSIQSSICSQSKKDL